MIEITSAATPPDSWKEVCLIGIIPDGGSETAWGAMTDDITGIKFMQKDIDVKQNVIGGYVTTHVSSGPCELTLKMTPITCLVNGTGLAQWFYPQSTADATQPILADATTTKTKHAIIITWAYPSLPATAGATISADGTTTVRRIQIINAYMTNYSVDFSDKNKTAEVTFKWAPLNKSASANERHESCDGSAVFPDATTSATSFV